MNTTVFQGLKRLYQNSSDLMILADENWNILWSSRAVVLPNLRQRLILPEDSWESVIRPFPFENALYRCDVQCSQEDGLRILHFMPLTYSTCDFETITAIVQSMITICTALHTKLQEQEDDELLLFLNALTGDIMRIYRIMFIENEIEKGQRDEWKNDFFELRSVLDPIRAYSQDLLRQFAKVTCLYDADRYFVRGDVNAFRNTITAALVLCIRKPEQQQQIVFNVTHAQEEVTLLITVTPGKGIRTDLKGQLYSFGSLEPEKQLFRNYCRFAGIEPVFTEKGDSVSCCITLPQYRQTRTIRLGTTGSNLESGFFKPVDVMLARIRFRNYF